MTSEQTRVSIPRIAYRSVAGGLLLMAFFTALWASWSQAGLPEPVGLPLLAVFGGSVAAFVVTAIVLLRASAHLRDAEVNTVVPDEPTPYGRDRGFWFGIVFAAEGAAIAAACIVLGRTGLTEYINPAIALIVGAHFIPLARIFDRALDFFVGGGLILAALIGIALIASDALPRSLVWSLVSIAAACATSVYGFFMVAAGRALLAAR